MKWIAFICGVFLIILAWLIVQIGKGVLFTHSGFEHWDEAFLVVYRDCCQMTDLRTAAPVGLLGAIMLAFAVWKFVRG